MATLVGTQTEFHDALYALCELDYDAIEAYQAAINRLKNESYKEQLTQFMDDHLRHVDEISAVLKRHQQAVPKGPGMKKYLTQGKVVLAHLLGDNAILKAMITNEADTNTAYERVNSHANKWDDATDILSRGLSDEKRHKKWLEETVKQPSGS